MHGRVIYMKNYIQTKEITEQFNISRANIYYWIKNKKISKPIKNSTNHYLWEQKHIEEIKDLLKIKIEKLDYHNDLEYFELNNRRYLGNKYKLTPFIKKVIIKNCENIKSFFDVFSGTGVVADAFKEYDLITNDILFSNYVSHYAFFSNESYDKKKLISIIKKWNNIKNIKKDNYMSINFGGKYFSLEVAKKIGYIRDEIQEMFTNGKLNKREEYILITALIYAMDRIANTCGHYDAYRKGADFNNDFLLKFPNIKSNKNKNNKIFNMDSNVLVRQVYSDIAYIDPPYNSRQYSDAYHLLENVARWEKPEVFGVAAKMDRKNIKSNYCTKKAPETFKDLIDNLEAKYILVSYNNMGEKGDGRSNAKITDREIIEILSNKGEIQIFEQEYKAFSTGKSKIDDNVERLFLCKVEKYNQKKNKKIIDIPSPLNYTGGKYKLLDQIKNKFPKKIDSMIDLFSGGCNVGINVDCKKVKFIDKQKNLIRLFNSFKNHTEYEIISQINNIMEDFSLSQSDIYGYEYYNCNSSKGLANYNKNHYLKLRNIYNCRKEENFYYDMIFYVLIIFGFNNQIRFNKKGEFNLPVGKRDFNSKMKKKLIDFINRIKQNDYEFISEDFINIDPNTIDKSTFVYADPPYLIANASYNEQGGWNEFYEEKLLMFLDKLNKNGTKFALSNVLESKGKRNNILINWIIKNKNIYKVHYLDYNYSNSNYQTKDRNKNSTVEVLITNY